MITAKAIKPTSLSQTQPTREDYFEPDQKKGRFLPLAFLVFLTGCATYLKSFMPVKMEAGEEQQSRQRDDGSQDEPRSEEEISVAAEEEVATESKDNANSSDNVVPIRIAYDDRSDPTSSVVIEPPRPITFCL